MQSQVDGVTQWEQNLSTLANKGINEGILQKLAEMGPQGSGYVAAFASMTDEELAKANELWSQSVDIKGMTDQWGQQLLESGAANIAGGMENLAPIMQQSGANTVAGLVKGMQDAQAAAEAQGHDLGVKVIESVNNGLDVRSPSAKTTRSGIYVDQGLRMDEFRESNCDDCKHGSCNDDYKSAKLYADSNTICKYRNEDTRRTCAGNTTGKITSDICDNGSDRGSHQGSKRKT